MLALHVLGENVENSSAEIHGDATGGVPIDADSAEREDTYRSLHDSLQGACDAGGQGRVVNGAEEEEIVQHAPHADHEGEHDDEAYVEIVEVLHALRQLAKDDCSDQQQRQSVVTVEMQGLGGGVGLRRLLHQHQIQRLRDDADATDDVVFRVKASVTVTWNVAKGQSYS